MCELARVRYACMRGGRSWRVEGGWGGVTLSATSVPVVVAPNRAPYWDMGVGDDRGTKRARLAGWSKCTTEDEPTAGPHWIEEKEKNRKRKKKEKRTFGKRNVPSRSQSKRPSRFLESLAASRPTELAESGASRKGG